MTHPYYMIDYSASACMFEIRVNDYPVITMNIEGQIATMTPINFAILKSGLQSLSVKILPILGTLKLDPDADLKFNIKLFDVANDFVFKNQFEEYQSEKIGRTKKLPILSHVSSFTAEVPYKSEAWQKGTNLKDIKDLLPKLKKAYVEIGILINNKKYEAFKEKIAKREKYMSNSMYLSKQESDKRVNMLIKDFDSGFKVMPLSNEVILQIYSNSKVAAIKKPNGESALYLYNKETKEELMLDLTFYIPEGKTEFEVI